MTDTDQREVLNDSCGPDDPGQDYIECPNCAAGRVYSLECDCCGWTDGQPLRDWSRRRKNRAAKDAGGEPDA